MLQNGWFFVIKFDVCVGHYLLFFLFIFELKMTPRLFLYSKMPLRLFLYSVVFPRNFCDDKPLYPGFYDKPLYFLVRKPGMVAEVTILVLTCFSPKLL